MAVMTVGDVEQIVVDCTGDGEDLSFEEVVRSHRMMGRFGCGSHFVITRDGRLHQGRELTTPGVGMPAGNNRSTVGVLLVGGDPRKRKPFAAAQLSRLDQLMTVLEVIYPEAARADGPAMSEIKDL